MTTSRAWWNDTTIIVDDSDADIVYSGGWVIRSGSDNYMGSTHASFSSGNTATFKFNGE